MAKDPAVLFYTSDFLTGTMTMSNEHIGMYIKLLCMQHQKGRLAEKDMLFICSTYVEDVYDKFEKDADGFYYNVRMKNEAEKRKKYSESRSKNVSKRYKKVSKSNKKNKLDKSTYVGTHVVHMENENINENININRDKFEDIWSKYPNKDGKAKARQSFNKTVKNDTDWNNINNALNNYLNSERVKKGFIKNGSTWFNDWEGWVEFNESAMGKNEGQQLLEKYGIA